jgi:hypothetical protein
MTEYYTLGEYDAQGVPKYLSGVETIVPSLLDRILEAVPERTNIPRDKPSFIAEDISRNIIIKSDENFNGCDVYMTFLLEGAGYKNTIGYYHYPLNGGFTVPTKLVNNNYVPMTYDDRNSKNGSGKSILNKTIVFPNASLPSWANNNGKNSQAGGGNLYPGSRVKLVYDITDPTKPFPNNTGIGFFVIPNGWNGSKVTNWAESVHTDAVFNYKSYVQTIPLFDAQTSTNDMGIMIVAFEDIMRPNGDNDFNDVVIQLDFTNRSKVVTDKFLVLPESGAVAENNLIIDKTGVYYQFTNAVLNDYLKLDCDEFEFVHTIKMSNEYEHKTTLKQIFRELNLSNGGHLKEDEEYDEDEDREDVIIVYSVLKGSLRNYNYFINSFINRDGTSPINPNVSALVEFQNIYLVDQHKCIKGQHLKIRNKKDKSRTYKSDPIIPKINSGDRAYVLGDPHIKTIYNFKYDLPNTPSIYQLYNDGETIINTLTDYFYMNKGLPVFEDLTFMRYLSIQVVNKGYVIVDMYHPDTYYVYGANNKFIKIAEHVAFNFGDTTNISLAENSRADFAKLVGTNQFIMKYINFRTNLLGNTAIELIFMPHRKDLVNSISLLSNNLLMTSAKGALISPKQVYTLENLV